jgi:thiol-disulfide isomerase/thioredoxin
MNKKDYIFFGLFGMVIISLIVVMIVYGKSHPEGTEDPQVGALASCLKEKGVLFYGASWCPHCQKQKQMFGVFAEKLPYIECASTDPKNPQQEVCAKANIESYPTWRFPNGEELKGEVSFEMLAEKSGCPFTSSN